MTHGKVKVSALMSTGLALLLCAGCTTVSADNPPPRQCSKYVDPFLDETPHATAPANAESREWVGFSVSEAGQLEIANHDKSNARKVLNVCEQETLDANKRAARRVKPWYKKIF
jgi:hypothetical protein